MNIWEILLARTYLDAYPRCYHGSESLQSPCNPSARSRIKRLLVSGGDLYAPDLIYAEVDNVIWKRRGRQEIDDGEAAELLADLLGLPLDITPSEQLVGQALDLAMRTGRTVYDCLYVALAVQTKTVMFSDDRRLVNAFADGPLKDRVAWLGEAR